MVGEGKIYRLNKMTILINLPAVEQEKMGDLPPKRQAESLSGLLKCRPPVS
jgi:hypothetical protein